MNTTSAGPRDKGRYYRKITELLTNTDIRINGDRPWDIRVKDERFFRWILAEGSLALGESYMEGMWECDRIDEMIYRLLSSDLDRIVRPRALLIDVLRARIKNLQSPARSFTVGEAHYDLGNDLYRRMLDPYMIYSCAYWKEAADLEAAQEAKLDLICRKLGLEPGMSVLDIGCGWGGTARFMAERYGCRVTGVTVSKRQVEYAREFCRGLPVEIRLQDYRELSGSFDRIVSVGMFEHVGARNYRTYMQTAARLLIPEGLFLLHTIGSGETSSTGEPWLSRYIFPNSMIPSPRQVTQAAEGLFVIEDWHNFGADYHTTLMHWHQNFRAAWPELQQSYDERFRRMWSYFLLSCAGSFRARRNQLWQIVLSPKGVPGGYESLR